MSSLAVSMPLRPLNCESIQNIDDRPTASDGQTRCCIPMASQQATNMPANPPKTERFSLGKEFQESQRFERARTSLDSGLSISFSLEFDRPSQPSSSTRTGSPSFRSSTAMPRLRRSSLSSSRFADNQQHVVGRHQSPPRRQPFCRRSRTSYWTAGVTDEDMTEDTDASSPSHRLSGSPLDDFREGLPFRPFARPQPYQSSLLRREGPPVCSRQSTFRPPGLKSSLQRRYPVSSHQYSRNPNWISRNERQSREMEDGKEWTC